MSPSPDRGALVLFYAYLVVVLSMCLLMAHCLGAPWAFPVGVAAVAVIRYARKTRALDPEEGAGPYLALLLAGVCACVPTVLLVAELPPPTAPLLVLGALVGGAILVFLVVEVVVFSAFVWAVLRPR